MFGMGIERWQRAWDKLHMTKRRPVEKRGLWGVGLGACFSATLACSESESSPMANIPAVDSEAGTPVTSQPTRDEDASVPLPPGSSAEAGLADSGSANTATPGTPASSPEETEALSEAARLAICPSCSAGGETGDFGGGMIAQNCHWAIVTEAIDDASVSEPVRRAIERVEREFSAELMWAPGAPLGLGAPASGYSATPTRIDLVVTADVESRAFLDPEVCSEGGCASSPELGSARVECGYRFDEWTRVALEVEFATADGALAGKLQGTAAIDPDGHVRDQYLSHTADNSGVRLTGELPAMTGTLRIEPDQPGALARVGASVAFFEDSLRGSFIVETGEHNGVGYSPDYHPISARFPLDDCGTTMMPVDQDDAMEMLGGESARAVAEQTHSWLLRQVVVDWSEPAGQSSARVVPSPPDGDACAGYQSIRVDQLSLLEVNDEQVGGAADTLSVRHQLGQPQSASVYSDATLSPSAPGLGPLAVREFDTDVIWSAEAEGPDALTLRLRAEGDDGRVCFSNSLPWLRSECGVDVEMRVPADAGASDASDDQPSISLPDGGVVPSSNSTPTLSLLQYGPE